MCALVALSCVLRKRIKRAMYKGLFVRILLCLFCMGFALYTYLDKQNELTSLRIAIPTKMKQLKAVQEENVRLRYEIKQFENPVHLMELARNGEFSHLRQPLLTEVIMLREELVVQEKKGEESSPSYKISPSLAIGANP